MTWGRALKIWWSFAWRSMVLFFLVSPGQKLDPHQGMRMASAMMVVWSFLWPSWLPDRLLGDAPKRPRVRFPPCGRSARAVIRRASCPKPTSPGRFWECKEQRISRPRYHFGAEVPQSLPRSTRRLVAQSPRSEARQYPLAVHGQMSAGCLFTPGAQRELVRLHSLSVAHTGGGPWRHS